MVYLWQINAKHLVATKSLLRRPSSRTSTENIQPYTSHIHLNILSISMNHSSTSHQYPWKLRNKTKIGRFGWLNFCNGWNSRGISWDLIGFNHQKSIKNHQKPSHFLEFRFQKTQKQKRVAPLVSGRPQFPAHRERWGGFHRSTWVETSHQWDLTD